MKNLLKLTIHILKTCFLLILLSCFIGFSAELKPADLKQQAFVLYYSNQYYAAAAMAEKAVEVACQEFDATNSLLADYYNFFGFLSVKADKFRDAEYAFRAALSIRQNNFGSNSLEVAESLNNLAEALKYLSKYNESEQCHSNAFAVRKKLLPLGHKLILESLNN
ncbi:MAG: tetratricopeptide repeat protein, partial [Alphaproteobacteria bacterium]